jgi:DNA (cytosine-5)-methyltransferase 1
MTAISQHEVGMKVLDLFSGIGGFSLGLERAGMQTVAFCEIEDYPRRVLKKHWPDVPIFEDIKKLKGEDCGPVELICGGYPCQPFSTAGKRGGEADDRALWPEYLRLIRELRPRWVIGENVAGHISMGLDKVLSDLEAEGYTWEAFVIPACAVDARHRRDRVWIVANSGRATSTTRNNKREKYQQKNGDKIRPFNRPVCATMANTSISNDGRSNTGAIEGQKPESGNGGIKSHVSDSKIKGLEGCGASFRTGPEYSRFGGSRRWPTEPAVGRVANGIPSRVDRLKALGNAVVPQIPEIIGRAIMQVEAGIES